MDYINRLVSQIDRISCKMGTGCLSCTVIIYCWKFNNVLLP